MQTIFYSSPRKRTSKHHRPSNNITKVSSQVYGLELRVLNLITADGTFCVLKRVLATHHPSFQACKLGKKQAHCLRKTQRERGCVCEREKRVETWTMSSRPSLQRWGRCTLSSSSTFCRSSCGLLGSTDSRCCSMDWCVSMDQTPATENSHKYPEQRFTSPTLARHAYADTQPRELPTKIQGMR